MAIVISNENVAHEVGPYFLEQNLVLSKIIGEISDHLYILTKSAEEVNI